MLLSVEVIVGKPLRRNARRQRVEGVEHLVLKLNVCHVVYSSVTADRSDEAPIGRQVTKIRSCGVWRLVP